MFEKFYPDYYVDSVFTLNYQELKEEGICGVIYDIDNTLVCHDEPADERACALFAQLRELGLKSCVLSNNDRPRVSAFAEAVGADVCIYKAGKPSPKNYLKALELMGCRRETAVFAGDQLFTDVLGAKQAGIRSYLVKPVGPEKLLKIKVKRLLEKPILAEFRRRAENG